MPRALLLCEYPALNGGERSLLAVLPTLQRAGWEFDAWCPGAGPLTAAFAALGVRTIAHAPITDPRTTLAERRADLSEVLSCAPRYDLVHANSLATGRVSGPVVEAMRTPSITHLRDIVGLNRTAVADLNRHRRLLAVSAATRAHHVAQGIAADKSEVLYNGIDRRCFDAAAPTQYLHRELGVFSFTKFVAVIGQLILRKGQDASLTAAVAAMERNCDLHVLVVGKRHSEKFETIAFEEKLHDLPQEYADRVHFLGTRMDVPRLLAECSLLLHMARQEPLGRVLLEAAASGLPIVATDVGGTREIFPREQKDGAILVGVDDIDAATKAIGRVLRSDELFLDMSSAGRERIAAAFTVEQSAAGLLRHYAEVSGR